MNFKQLSNMDKLTGEYWLEEASKLMDIVNRHAVTVEDMEVLAKFTEYRNIHGNELDDYLNNKRKYNWDSIQMIKEELHND